MCLSHFRNRRHCQLYASARADYLQTLLARTIFWDPNEKLFYVIHGTKIYLATRIVKLTVRAVQQRTCFIEHRLELHAKMNSLKNAQVLNFSFYYISLHSISPSTILSYSFIFILSYLLYCSLFYFTKAFFITFPCILPYLILLYFTVVDACAFDMVY